MHDALLSRFRGAYLGAALGERMGARVATSTATSAAISAATNVATSSADPEQRRGSLAWTEQILAQTRSCLASELPHPEAQPDLRSDRPIARLLPLALLHHDQPLALQHRLAWAFGATDAPDLKTSLPELWAALILGQAISLILRERFAPQTLIPQVLQDLDLPDLPAVGPLLSQLTTVQTWLEQAADLAKVSRHFAASRASAESQRFGREQFGREQFGPEALGLVLYCFLSCPGDGQTLLLRFSRLQPVLPAGSSALAGAILGALAGLYSGLPGLPLVWRQAGCGSAGDLSEAVLFQHADRLLAQWSGVLGAEGLGQPHRQITAAPRVIQLGG